MMAELINEYIPRRMYELGQGTRYLVRFRHLVMQPKEKRKIYAGTHIFLLIDPCGDIRVESDVGLYDLSEEKAGEMQYEHRGEINVTNYSAFKGHVKFIQVIPQICKTLCP